MVSTSPIESGNQNYSSTAQEQETPIDSVISDLDNLPEQKKTALKNALLNGTLTVDQALQFLDLFKQLPPALAASLLAGMQSNPDADANDLLAVANQFAQDDGNLEQIATDQPVKLGRAMLAIAKVATPGSEADSVNQVTNALQGQTKLEATATLNNYEQLVASMKGNDDPSDPMADYSSAADPVSAFTADTNNLRILNEAMQGQGQFTLADLQSFGLSTRNQSPDQAQKKTAEFAQSLTGISQQGSIVNSPETVRQFIANYRQGGGVDAAQALSMVPQVDEAIAQLKAKLGLAPDQPLTGEYQAHLLAKFGRAGNAEGIDAVVQAEMNRIDLAFPSAKGKPLTSQQGSQYVTVGFNLPQSQLPLETAESKTNPKPVARPNSALNSGSQLGNTPVKSLEDRGYNDIQQSPLYSERELQSEFKGDTKKYAQYLARAHYLVEDVLRIPIQDFDGKPSPGDKPGAVAAEGELKNNIKGYLFSRGYDEQSLVAEIGYIQSVRNHFGASAQASGVGGTNPALKSFNAEDYVESGGRVYQYDVPAEIKRPSGPGAMPEVIPASVGRGLIEGASAHETGVLHRAERSQFLQNQMNAHQGLVNLMRDAEKTEANAGEDGEVDMSKADEMKQKVDVRNRFDLMENFMETQAGNKKYIDQDGKAVMAFDAKGQPIMDKTGQHMSLLAFDALKKYGSPETVKLSLQNPNSPDVQAALKGGMKLNAEAISSEAKAKDPNIPDVNYAATKSSELDVNTQETHAETIQKDVDANQRKIEELNENLKTFTAHFDNVGKAFADVFNQETESVSRLFQLMNS